MDDKAPEVDKLFAKWDKADTPGCALAVMQTGKIIYERGYGLANLDHNVPISPATVFHVASMSKQFTAAAIAMLALDGKLSLDDPARKYVPELPDFGAPITLRQLVHHTSGLRDQWELLGLAGWRYSLDLITNDDVLAVVSRQKELNFPPGSEFMYSNTGYTILAEIVRRVSGQSFRDFTRSRIFEPLDMKDTHFRDDHAEIVKDVAYGYAEQGTTFRLSITNFDTVGATSLLTTVRDLAKWDENFYTGRVYGPTLLAQMLEPGKLGDGKPLDYAFGLMISPYRCLPTVHHAGADAGYRAELVRFPNQRFSVACLCNLSSIDPSSLARKVADIYLVDELQPEILEVRRSPIEVSTANLVSKIGLYVNEEADDLVRIEFKNGKLLATALWEQVFDLVPLSEYLFRLADFPVELQFSDGSANSSARVTVSAPLQRPRTYELASEFKPDASTLEEYIGTYYSEEVETRYHVATEGGKLVLTSIKLKAIPLRPATEDLFSGWFGRVRFTRDSHGVVSGMRFNSSRVRHFRFDKVN